MGCWVDVPTELVGGGVEGARELVVRVGDGETELVVGGGVEEGTWTELDVEDGESGVEVEVEFEVVLPGSELEVEAWVPGSEEVVVAETTSTVPA